MAEDASRIPWDHWPCECAKRDRQGRLTAVKWHPPAVKRCRVCKAVPRRSAAETAKAKKT